MSQNTSSAVMAQRVEAHDSLDHFPTPPWATRALCEWLLTKGEPIRASLVWEPACAEGHMAAPLGEYFAEVSASDVHDYGYGMVCDFLLADWVAEKITADWVITNPPFRLGRQFIETALKRASRGVAMLVRTAFLESAERYDGSGPKGDGVGLFKPNPPSEILQFVERVPMFKGRLDRRGSTATAYCWLVWRKNLHGAPFSRSTSFHWLAPCRARLERDSDYPASSA